VARATATAATAVAIAIAIAMNDAPHPALLPAGLYDLLPPEAEIEAAVTAR
jgi:hypothetical protein